MTLGTKALAGLRVPIGYRERHAWDEAVCAHIAAAVAVRPLGAHAVPVHIRGHKR